MRSKTRGLGLRFRRGGRFFGRSGGVELGSDDGRNFAGFHGILRRRSEVGHGRVGRDIDRRQGRSRRFGSAVTDVNVAQIQQEAEHKKCDRRVDRGLGQDIAGVGAESGFGGTTTEGSAHAAVVFGLLHKHEKHQKEGYKDKDERENTDEEIHGNV